MNDAHAPQQTSPDSTADAPEPPEVLADQLVEEVSIDGMCGVY